jgi:hypothetical protein
MHGNQYLLNILYSLRFISGYIKNISHITPPPQARFYGRGGLGGVPITQNTKKVIAKV